MNNEEIIRLKKAIRIKIRDMKKTISEDTKAVQSQSIFQTLVNKPDFQNAQTILCYWSMPDEVHTHDFVMQWYKKKTILLPVVQGNELELKIFQGLDSMQTGTAYGIKEPIGSVFQNFSDIDIIIVPGVAFDKMGNRLGRGKAYYDKLLRVAFRAKKIGVCFDFQFIEKIPVEVHDIPMDEVLIGRNTL